MALKVYVTDYDYGTLDPEKNEVAKIGAVLVPTQSKTEDAIIENCKDADGLLTQYAPITRKVMESLPNLKVVGRYGVGVNTVDLKAATDLGIQVVNVPDFCMDEEMCIRDSSRGWRMMDSRLMMPPPRMIRSGLKRLMILVRPSARF